MKPSTARPQHRPRRFQPCPGEHAWREADKRLVPSGDVAIVTETCQRCRLVRTRTEVVR